MNLIKILFVLSVAAALAACETVNDKTVLNMPTAKLCDFLGPAWITLPGERTSIFHELEKRGAQCASGYVAKEGRDRGTHKKKKGQSSGSGVVFDSNGYVLTNEHVVSECDTLSVIRDRNTYPATVYGKDGTNDIAILRTPISGVAHIVFRHSSKLELAEPVMVLGYPLRTILSDQLHATSGHITALAGINGDSRFFQLSAPIQPGNSGGPIVDESGLVIGLATSKLNAITVAKITGDVPQNVNFGLKSALFFNLLDGLNLPYTAQTKSDKLEKTDIVKEVGSAVVTVLCNHQ